MRTHQSLGDGATGGGWLDQTRSCGKVRLPPFLPTAFGAFTRSSLRLARSPICRKETHSSHWAL